jgi:hypothetical protein
MISDGTVILMADLKNPTTQKFIQIGNAVERFLKEELPYIFDPSFKRRFLTMWCTLGYFDCDDFDITEDIRDTFYSFVAPTLNINELYIMEFRTKDLEGANPIGEPILL